MSGPFEPPSAASQADLPAFTFVLEMAEPVSVGWNNRSSFPVPDLGERCVCCNAATHRMADYDPANSDQIAERLPIRVCNDCKGHLSLSPQWGDQFLGLAGGLGAMLTLFGLGFLVCFGKLSWMLGAGVAGLVGAIAAYQLGRWNDARRARNGHHTMFELRVGPGWAVVHTSNRVLVDHLCTCHPEGTLTDSGSDEAPV